MDTLSAARLHMTVTLVFHIVFAAVGIGLPLLMVIAEGAYLRTGQGHYRELARRWAKATGLLFVVGAVSGTALSLELGLLWPRYLELLGAVVGHIFGLEGFAFFLEAIFLGLYLYGWDRLSPRAHWLCGVVIAASGMMSGVLVLGVNAWMQQPVGFEMAAGQVTVTDPVAVFKQPLWFYMALHSTLSCYIAVGFAAAAWYAWRALRGDRGPYVKAGLSIGMAVGGAAAVLMPLSGDLLAKFVFKTQPVKFAAMEGQFRTESHAPLRIGGWPNAATGETPWAIEIPGGLSYLAGGSTATEVRGLDQTSPADWPNVELTHVMFQIMVVAGTALVALAAWFGWAAWRGGATLLDRTWLMRGLLVAGPLGFVALEAGWCVTEVGRQPWVIQQVMRTSEAVTPAAGVPWMLALFVVLYVVLGTTVVALLRRLAQS